MVLLTQGSAVQYMYPVEPKRSWAWHSFGFTVAKHVVGYLITPLCRASNLAEQRLTCPLSLNVFMLLKPRAESLIFTYKHGEHFSDYKILTSRIISTKVYLYLNQDLNISHSCPHQRFTRVISTPPSGTK